MGLNCVWASALSYGIEKLLKCSISVPTYMKGHIVSSLQAENEWQIGRMQNTAEVFIIYDKYYVYSLGWFNPYNIG